MSNDAAPPTDQPDFDAPPVVEVALGVQFRPLFGLRPIELAGLRDRWRPEYPKVQEQPPLASAIEGPTLGGSTVQLVMGPALQTRVWFLNESSSELVQVQHDRFIVNWRQVSENDTYPRYPQVKALFEKRITELEEYLGERNLGQIRMTQVEVNYINAVDTEPTAMGELERLLRNWQPTVHHLGQPERATVSHVYRVPDLGTGPARMYVAVEPAERTGGRSVLFLTLTLRGAPAGESTGDALQFMDGAHDHLVESFSELTPEAIQTEWGRR